MAALGRSWAGLGPVLAALGPLLATSGATVGGQEPSWPEKWPKPEREREGTEIQRVRPHKPAQAILTGGWSNANPPAAPEPSIFSVDSEISYES